VPPAVFNSIGKHPLADGSCRAKRKPENMIFNDERFPIESKCPLPAEADRPKRPDRQEALAALKSAADRISFWRAADPDDNQIIRQCNKTFFFTSTGL
jgi:hypothetical protein